MALDIAAASDPITGLLLGYPTGTILVRDSLAASSHFLLPQLTAAALQQGHKVSESWDTSTQEAHSPHIHRAEGVVCKEGGSEH